MELKPEEALRRKHNTIYSILDGSEETLRSFSIALFEEGIIDRTVKGSVSRTMGMKGADTLLKHVELMVRQQPEKHFETLLKLMERQLLLKSVAIDLKQMTGRKKVPEPDTAADQPDTKGQLACNVWGFVLSYGRDVLQ